MASLLHRSLPRNEGKRRNPTAARQTVIGEIADSEPSSIGFVTFNCIFPATICSEARLSPRPLCLEARTRTSRGFVFVSRLVCRQGFGVSHFRSADDVPHQESRFDATPT